MEQDSLFSIQEDTRPLADRMRPETLDEYVGQKQLVAKGNLLWQMIEHDQVTSMIFWGPPGVGKTTLARIIAHQTKSYFVDFSAVTSGIKEIKEVKRGRIKDYLNYRPNAKYVEGAGLWQAVKVDVALPCATQNELDLDDAKALVANGVISVTEGANMPTTLEATKYLQENGVLFVGGKAANAGGVATSALEMSQNSERLSWTFEEVDGKLKGIMETIYANISDAAKIYDMTVGGKTDYVAGANIAGFEKVVNAMLAQGVY